MASSQRCSGKWKYRFYRVNPARRDDIDRLSLPSGKVPTPNTPHCRNTMSNRIVDDPNSFFKNAVTVAVAAAGLVAIATWDPTILWTLIPAIWVAMAFWRGATRRRYQG